MKPFFIHQTLRSLPFLIALALLAPPLAAQTNKPGAGSTTSAAADNETCGSESDDSISYFVDHTPLEIPGGRYVTTKEAKALFDQGVLFIDARIPAEFAEQTIKGAINLPYHEQFARTSLIGKQDQFDLTRLPGDKTQPLVFFCNGSPCWKGYKAARKAIDAGYQAVHWYRDGLPAWQRAGYPTAPGKEQR